MTCRPETTIRSIVERSERLHNRIHYETHHNDENVFTSIINSQLSVLYYYYLSTSVYKHYKLQ